MIGRSVLAVVVALAVGLLCLLVGAILGALNVPIAQTVGHLVPGVRVGARRSGGGLVFHHRDIRAVTSNPRGRFQIERAVFHAVRCVCVGGWLVAVARRLRARP